MNNLYNINLDKNNLYFYLFSSCSIVLILGFYILKNPSNNIETPNSPQTFNFTRNQLREIEVQAENTVNPDFIKAGENCYPKKYPTAHVDDIIEKVDFVSDFPVKASINNLVEKMDYLSIERDFISSPLENNINLDFLIILISVLIISLLIRQKYGRETLLLILILILITFIIFKMSSLYAMCILIPFSLFEIDFRDSFDWEFKSYRGKPVISHMKLQTLTEDITKLLDSLKDDEDYSMSLSFISTNKKWKDKKEKVHPHFIDNPIIINKESDPILITQFIMNRLNDKGHFITNWLFNDSSINSMDPIILMVIVAINVII